MDGEAETVDQTGALTETIAYFSRVVLGVELWGDRLAFASFDVACLCC